MSVLEMKGVCYVYDKKRSDLKLSGGQQQRTAIARALASDARILLADEPTGSLDEDTASEITEILKGCARESGKCVVIATHSHELADAADIVLRLRKGELQTVKADGGRPCGPG